MRPRRQQGFSMLAGNPVLIGAITVLVTVVAVFLAYNANAGLPFTPSYDVDAVVPNAAGLIRGNQVRIGGTLVGQMTSLDTVVRRNGSVYARLHLRLVKSIEPLPVDSLVAIRPISPLGLKYVQITLGHSSKGVPPGAQIPLAPITPKPTEVDDFFNIFNPPTRAASKTSLDEFGTGVAGRGTDLNAALSQLEPLVTRLGPVTRNLLRPSTRLAQLFPALERAAREVAPVAGTQASLFVALDRTFGALSRVTGPIQQTIARAPVALDVATRNLPEQAPFLRDSTELFRRLRPGFASFASASVHLAPAFAEAPQTLQNTPALARRLDSTFEQLNAFAVDSRVIPGLQRLTDTATTLEDPVAFITPAQTTCNYLALFFRNIQSSFSEGDSIGTFLRFGILALPQNPNSEAGPSSAPANGPAVDPIKFPLSEDSFLHSNPYPNTASPGQPHECEAGNEKYTPGQQQIGNSPGVQPAKTETTTRSSK
jgi:phospholipid/cholesterol/gamma-HCH transport system substrate-binding protein